MNDRLRVGISEFRVARAPAILTFYNLGACLGIILEDRKGGIGGLVHPLLISSQ